MFSEVDKDEPEEERGMYNAYEKDIAVVSFYFGEPTVFEYHRKPTLTWVGFFSQMGGLLGLCLGFSIASMVEVVYWFGFRMWISCRKKDTQVANSGLPSHYADQ